MKFTLTIELGNDAMQTQADIASALAEYVASFRDEQASPSVGDFSSIFDVNGNRVGGWSVTE